MNATEEEKRIKLLEYAGWTELYRRGQNKNFALSGICPQTKTRKIAPNPFKSLDMVRKIEFLLWRDEAMVESYEENIQKLYLKDVGYQGASYWFMAGPKIRSEALIKTFEEP